MWWGVHDRSGATSSCLTNGDDELMLCYTRNKTKCYTFNYILNGIFDSVISVSLLLFLWCEKNSCELRKL